MKHTFVTFFAAVGAATFAIHCGSDGADCNETRTCVADPVEGGADADGGPDVVVVPEGCDLTKDAKDAPKCVVSEVGVFVDGAGGNDGNAGTKESPVKSIGAALTKLGGRTRLYICEGTYEETVKLTSAVSVYGGFVCAGWSHAGGKSNVAPKEAGKYALEVAAGSGALVLQDLKLTAPAATTAAPSSIAVFARDSSDVTLARCDVKASAGQPGSEGAAGATGTPDKALDGMSADLATAGAAKSCTCSSGGTSNGGGGGGVNSDGQKGGPNISENPVGLVPPHDGVGGTGNTNCGAGGLGRTGADASNSAVAAAITTQGALAATGWMPKEGAAGASAGPGQGGGGGGGRAGGGGGGACGGCGGTGGKGGGGGGASIALVSFNSSVKLRGGTVASANAGAGGKGGAPGTGATGGGGGAGAGAPAGCGAGDGGKGGDGGAGGGGAGGVSAAVFYRGAKPTVDGAALTFGDLGAKGPGGATPTNDGVDGLKGDIVEAPAP